LYDDFIVKQSEILHHHSFYSASAVRLPILTITPITRFVDPEILSGSIKGVIINTVRAWTLSGKLSKIDQSGHAKLSD
jgi:hypothetical protein